VLKAIAQLLDERCRSSDMIARYGGEEFLLCFPKTDGATAAQVCDELRLAIERADWSFVAADVSVTLSFGLAECQPDFRRKSILSVADERLYAAKRNGRNQVVV
jgi:diguanylate cyclase (GGDEF)-like protein